MSNIDTTIQLNKLLEQQNKMLEAQGTMLKGQLGVMQRMVEALGSFNPSDKANDIRELNNVLDEMSGTVEKVGSSSTITEESFGKLAKSILGGSGKIGNSLKTIEKAALGFAPVSAMFSSVIGSFKLLKNGFLGIATFASAAVGSVMDLAFSIITFPFKILQGLIGLAGNHGDTELRQALENIRKEFGDLRKNGSEAIIDISRGLKGQLAETGLSTWRIFGNLAERLNTIREYATAMGTAFDLVRDSFVKNAERVGAYIKGLGLTEEGQKALAETAIRSGRSLQELGREITSFAYEVGESFGFNGKMISRDVGKMMGDFENFGNLGTQVLTNVSVYARRLGVEFEKLLGVVGKFDNFEDAAQGAAQLSQAFGLQLDTLQLINEQDPAARVEQLRKAFFAAGRSVETMTRQERALLASQTGLDQNTLSLVFSLKNQSKSYADIQRQSDATKKKQLSQAEAMEKLSNSIERLVKSGDFGSGGFFDRFLQGFSMGIRRSWEFRKVLYDLRNSLRIVYFAGVRVGRDFVKFFPGVKKFLTGLQDIFNPRKMRAKMTEVRTAFRQFFKTIQTEPEQALKSLFDKLHNVFFGNFSLRDSGGQKILQGIKAFTKALGNVLGSFMKLAIQGLTKGITKFLEFLKDPSGFVNNARSASGGIFEILSNMFGPALKAILDQGPAFLEAMGELLKFVLSKLKDKAIDLAREYWPVVAKGLISMVAVQGMITVLRAGFAFVFTKAISGAISGIGSSSQGLFSKLFSSVQKAAGQSIKGANLSGQSSAITGAIEAAGSASEASENTKVSAATVGKMLAIAAVIAIGMFAIMEGIVLVAKQIKENNLSPTTIATATGAMVAAGFTMLELAGVVSLLALVGPALSANAGPIAAGAAGVGIIATAMAGGMYLAIKAFGDISKSKIDKTVKVLDEAGDFFLVAGAVTGVAAAVGVGIVSSVGVGGLAVAAGLATIGVVVAAMTMTIKDVIDSINSIQVNEATKGKMEIYLRVFESISNFAKAIGSILDGISGNIISSISDALRGNNPINQLSNFIKTLGEQTNSLVNNVIEQSQHIQANETQLKKIEVVGNVLSTLASFAKNVVPREALSSSLFDTGVSEKLKSLSTFLGNVLDEMKEGIKMVVRNLKGIAGSTEEAEIIKKGAESVSSVINAIGSLASRILVSTVQYIKGDNLKEGLKSVGDMTKTVINSIVNSGIFSKINEFVVGISSTLDPTTVDRLVQVMPIITGAMSIVGQISSIISQAEFTGSARDVEQKTQSLGEFIGAISRGFTVQFGTVIDDLVAKFSGMKRGAINSIQTGLGTIGQLFETVGRTPELLKQLAGIGVESIASSFEKVQTTMLSMTNLFTGEHGLDFIISQIPDRGIARVTEGATAMVNSIKDIHRTINSLKGVDLNADLRVLNDRLGLGASRRLQIEQGNLEMNITVNVKLDVEELEEVLTTRPGGSRFTVSERNPWRGGV